MFVWDWGASQDIGLPVKKNRKFPNEPGHSGHPILNSTSPLPFSDEPKLVKVKNLCTVSEQQRRDPGSKFKCIWLWRLCLYHHIRWLSHVCTVHSCVVYCSKSSSSIKVGLKANFLFLDGLTDFLKNKRGKKRMIGWYQNVVRTNRIFSLLTGLIVLPHFRTRSSVISKHNFNIQWEDTMINSDFLENRHVDFQFAEIEFGGLVGVDNKQKAEDHFNKCLISYRSYAGQVFHLLLLGESYKTHLQRNWCWADKVIPKKWKLEQILHKPFLQERKKLSEPNDLESHWALENYGSRHIRHKTNDSCKNF